MKITLVLIIRSGKFPKNNKLAIERIPYKDAILLV